MGKGLVYGSVLVDDWPPYVYRWLRWRKAGWCVMPTKEWNAKGMHRQVLRYDGANLDEVGKGF